ncbi:MAG TPA: CocE/NonD family hydrolase [Candidatus Aminicenantes bacterium]|nr:CocE/NonD family hydrolase [Candidatus Aminicenantes bacterium]HRY65665.1 CocE/NonD family hydrolase [Candidatus Aminicenantes bacterium]HRZ72447.1 CocE/NonD family hydrolase [Candidatus Aminicenantes bacterium]
MSIRRPGPNAFSAVAPAVAAVLLAAVAAVLFAPPAPAAAGPGFTVSRAMIPMRDGIKLNTVIFAPEAAAGPLPFLIKRTPYGVPESAELLAGEPYAELVADGYIFVFQDIRGRFKSEGTFVMQRPPRDRRAPRAIDEATDAYDTVAWLLAHVPGHNGRAGFYGVSYDGWLAAQAMIDPHPALRAVSPQASPADMWLGDDFHHNGAFRLSYGFEYAAMMETSKESFNFGFDLYDTFEWYLRLGPLGAVNKRILGGRIPSWNDFVAHPNYDAFWQKQAMASYLTRVTVPALHVAGWWDQEDFYGPQKIYATLEPHDDRGLSFFVAGPWNHGGWMRDGSSLGRIKFGGDTAKYYRARIQAPFFARFLKDKPGWTVPEAITFETGTNAWQVYDAWPPRSLTEDRALYLREDGRLAFEPPASSDEGGFDSYVSDPAHPVPYRPRPIEPTYDPRGSGWRTWLVGDQRFAHLRPDVLSWETEPLAEDLTVTGRILARVFASTSGSDSDWIVKLIDVYPEDCPAEPAMGGYQLMIANEVFRGRFRKSFERPEPLVPGEVAEFAVDLHAADHRFLKGHRIMVQVQSTWFPLIDRNPQTYVDNIFLAGAEDFRPATQKVFRSKAHPSAVVLPVRVR